MCYTKKILGTPSCILKPVFLWVLLFFALASPATNASPLADQRHAYVYVFNVGSESVSIIDTLSNEVIVTVDVGFKVRWFATSNYSDGRYIWAVEDNPETATVLIFDPKTLKVTRRIPVGRGPSFGVELTADGKLALVPAAGDNLIAVIDTSTFEIVKKIPTGKFPCDIDIAPDGKLAFEPDRDQDTVSVIHTTTFEIVKVLPFEKGSKPHMLTVSPDGKFLWVEERDANAVSVVDTSNFEVVKTIPVGKGPVNTVFRPDGSYAYVTNKGDGSISVIDLTKLEVVKTLKVGKTPFGLLLVPIGL